MIVVSGCPRSGTSLMMDCLRIALGDDRILGHKFPQEESVIESKKRREDETDDHYKARMYMIRRMIILSGKESDMERTRDLNPNGFWECRYTVQGIHWHRGIEVKETDVCKIVSQGLFRSDPKYVDKVIFMARNPRQVAKSQERLRRIPFVSPEEEEGMKIHTPEMFINVTFQAAKWMKENPEKPILIVDFDNLISHPDETLEKIREFLGGGDFSGHPINPKLKRSYPEDIENDLWPHAEKMYSYLLEERWEDIIKYYEDNSDQITKDKRSVFCTRLNRNMVYNECLNCHESRDMRRNLRTQSEQSGIGWRFEPCMFDCLISLEAPLIPIEKSIVNNFWIE